MRFSRFLGLSLDRNLRTKNFQVTLEREFEKVSLFESLPKGRSLAAKRAKCSTSQEERAVRRLWSRDDSGEMEP